MSGKGADTYPWGRASRSSFPTRAAGPGRGRICWPSQPRRRRWRCRQLVSPQRQSPAA
eukprot:UN3480